MIVMLIVLLIVSVVSWAFTIAELADIKETLYFIRDLHRRGERNED